MEIERKFLVRPHEVENLLLTADSSHVIRQGYLPATEVEHRLRVVASGRRITYYETTKLGSGIARHEMEREISCDVFDSLWPQTVGRRVEKVRYLLPTNRPGLRELCVDVYSMHLAPLVVLEAEFNSIEAAHSFDLPSIGIEVTHDLRYRNASLATSGIPFNG